MPNPDKPSYSHGSTGSEPSSSLDYENGDPLDANNLDYYINTLFVKVKSIIDTLNTIDSDGDGKVDAADTADSATTASQVKGNDIDSNGDGKVNSADSADVADTANLYKGNDIDSDGDGKVDQADLADTATTANQVKGNDIDSDGDGKVNAADNADYATNAGDADTVDGKNASAFMQTSKSYIPEKNSILYKSSPSTSVGSSNGDVSGSSYTTLNSITYDVTNKPSIKVSSYVNERNINGWDNNFRIVINGSVVTSADIGNGSSVSGNYNSFSVSGNVTIEVQGKITDTDPDYNNYAYTYSADIDVYEAATQNNMA